MQNYPLLITPQSPTATFNVNGSGVWYESASGVTGDNRILVKPEDGNEVQLKPGQAVRFEKESGRFFVRNIDGTSSIQGNIIIGSGEFLDNANTYVSNFPASQVVTFTAPQPTTVQNNLLIQTSVLSNIGESVVTVNTVAASVSNDATLRRLVFRNSSLSGQIALGSNSVTIAKSAIVLQAGDVWIEENAAPANWYAISDTAGSTLQISTAR